MIPPVGLIRNPFATRFCKFLHSEVILCTLILIAIISLETKQQQTVETSYIIRLIPILVGLKIFLRLIMSNAEESIMRKHYFTRGSAPYHTQRRQ